MIPTIVVLNGPNLNLLGTREPAIYGADTLADIERLMAARAGTLGLAVEFHQSNNEGILIDWIHAARGRAQGLIVNAGGFSHTSIALLDAVLAVELPMVEVHLSNLFKREAFRHHSYLTSAAIGLISGFGAQGYVLALEALAHHLKLKGARS